jgi:hypothetical protein
MGRKVGTVDGPSVGLRDGSIVGERVRRGGWEGIRDGDDVKEKLGMKEGRTLGWFDGENDIVG